MARNVLMFRAYEPRRLVATEIGSRLVLDAVPSNR